MSKSVLVLDEIIPEDAQPVFIQDGDSLNNVGFVVPRKPGHVPKSQVTAYAAKQGVTVQVDTDESETPNSQHSWFIYPGGSFRDKLTGTLVRLWDSPSYPALPQDKNVQPSEMAESAAAAAQSNATPKTPEVLGPDTPAGPQTITDQAMVPGGGQATRLQPLTLLIPKPALNIGRDQTLIGRITGMLADSGIKSLSGKSLNFQEG